MTLGRILLICCSASVLSAVGGISAGQLKGPVAGYVPFARLTVECQTQWERENPNRKFKSSDSVGFSDSSAGFEAVSLDESA